MGCYGLLVDNLARPCLFSIISSGYLCHSRKILSQRLSSSTANPNPLVASAIENKVMGESLKLVYKPLQSTEGADNGLSVVAVGFQGCSAAETGASDDDNGAVTSTSFTARRPFCHTCRKAQSLCICVRIKMIVENKVGITILQHPEEKDHHLGTARIAALGLRNVQVLSISETDEKVSFRVRQKVPGSKRSIAGRVGNKGKVKLEPPTALVLTSDVPESEADHQQSCDPHVIPAWMNLPPGVGLLFPSDKAIDLVPELCEGKDCPSHLIVLDGTWSKAKRIYFENPWLHNLQHYNLPLSTPSMYGPVRRQPKEGCLSTVESIVCALKMLEPATVGLDSLLEVFNSMIEDAKGFQAQTELKHRRGAT